jgi:hypothetical protein
MSFFPKARMSVFRKPVDLYVENFILLSLFFYQALNIRAPTFFSSVQQQDWQGTYMDNRKEHETVALAWR